MFNSTHVDDRTAALITTYNATLQKHHSATKAVEEANKTLEIIRFQLETLKDLELKTKEEEIVDDDN